MITAQMIVDAVCKRMEIPLFRFWHVKDDRAVSATVNARAVASWLMRVMLEMSYGEISKFIGLASHRDVYRLVKQLSNNDRLTDIATSLWWELEQLPGPDLELHKEQIETGLSSLRRRIIAFEHEVGLHMMVR